MKGINGDVSFNAYEIEKIDIESFHYDKQYSSIQSSHSEIARN